MKLKGAIIVNQEIGHNQYKIERLLEEFDKYGIPIDVFKNDGTLAEIKNNNIVLNFDADFVLYLDKDIYLARFIEKQGIRLFNRADFIKLCDDKVLTFIACSNLGIKMPMTYAGPLMYREPKPEEYEFLNRIEESLGYPMVVKKVYGSLGEGVYLVKNREELYQKYSEIYRNPILFQKYVKTSKGHSIRALVIDGKVFGVFRFYLVVFLRIEVRSIVLHFIGCEMLHKVINVFRLVYLNAALDSADKGKVGDEAFFIQFYLHISSPHILSKSARNCFLSYTQALPYFPNRTA